MRLSIDVRAIRELLEKKFATDAQELRDVRKRAKTAGDTLADKIYKLQDDLRQAEKAIGFEAAKAKQFAEERDVALGEIDRLEKESTDCGMEKGRMVTDLRESLNAAEKRHTDYLEHMGRILDDIRVKRPTGEPSLSDFAEVAILKNIRAKAKAWLEAAERTQRSVGNLLTKEEADLANALR